MHTLIPHPDKVIETAGELALGSEVRLRQARPSLDACAAQLVETLAPLGIRVERRPDTEGKKIPRIVLELLDADEEGLGEEGYHLDVDTTGVTIRAANAAGVFYGIQTLRHLLSTSSRRSLPDLSIRDRPAHSWRGLMLDESRHFFGKEKVKQILDWMAFYKLNRFHWHLTDSPAWRLEIRAYPRLTSVGGAGSYSDKNAPVAFYTQSDIREVVEYARARHIEIVPEIDMPGHADAANRAYPELSGGGSLRNPRFTFHPAKEIVYRCLSEVLTEVAELFPSRWLHFGGDEVAHGSAGWADDPDVRSLMKEQGLADLAGAEHYFNRRMADVIHGLGKTVVGWDEIAKAGLQPEGAVLMWWRHNLLPPLELALRNGYGVVLCPRIPLYFDFVQHAGHAHGLRWKDGAFCDLETVYRGPVLPHSIDAAMRQHILGIQANVWSELIHTGKRLDFMIVPRLAALAEAAWTGQGVTSYGDFERRLKAHLPLYDAWGIAYFNPFDPGATPEPPGPQLPGFLPDGRPMKDTDQK